MVNIAHLPLELKLLAVDKGNTRTKVGTWSQDMGLQVAVFDNADPGAIAGFIRNQSFTASIISSVAAATLEKIKPLLEARGTCLELDASTALPIQIRYATPATLGADRIAGAIGSWMLTGKKDVLLVDAGTCINYECVIKDTYIGGGISPGLNMRLKAMHQLTGKLPLLDLPDGEIKLTGDSTATCMLSGAVMGAAMEVEGVVRQYLLEYPGIKVVLSGGDAGYLGKYLKNTIFARQNEIVIGGLLEILKHYLNV